MGTIQLVRHGQAAFGTDDYDRLTELGMEQSRLLGRYLRDIGRPLNAVFSGTLRRHIQTANAIIQGYEASDGSPATEVTILSGLEEYNPAALVAAHTGLELGQDPAAVKRDPEVVRKHFRILRDALIEWAEGRLQPSGMPAFSDFQAGAVHALAMARQRHVQDNILIVSSGGPIAAIICDALRAPSRTAVELNLRIRNCSVAEFSTSLNKHHIVGFNSVAHLEGRGDEALITYA